jgi:hypothetical protein
MEGMLNAYVTNPNPTPTLTPNPNRNPNSNPNQINEKIQKETTLEIDQITKCQFGRWKLVKTILTNMFHFLKQIILSMQLLAHITVVYPHPPLARSLNRFRLTNKNACSR